MELIFFSFFVICVCYQNNYFRSLIQRHFKMRNISYQTPQMEGGNLDTVLFGHSVGKVLTWAILRYLRL